jgi:hypothetical protein
LHPGPARREDDHDGDLAAVQVLLVSEVLVRGDEDLKASLFGGGNERAVAQL